MIYVFIYCALNIFKYINFFAVFTYKENELYHFLNAPDNLVGNIILAEYAKSRQIDHNKLKELIIIDELKRDPIHYK